MLDKPIIRVMLVDDQTATRAGFAMMLAATDDIRVTMQAANGATAIRQLRHASTPLPEVALMDVRMPTMDGIEATGRITREFPSIRVLLLTTYDQDDYALAGVARGAVGFLLKDATPEQLCAGIRAAWRGDAAFIPRIQRLFLDRQRRDLAATTRTDAIRARFRTLTPRELEVARLVADGLENADIARTLVIEVTSVRKTISRILPKLDVHDRTQIAVAWYKARMDDIT